MPSRRYTHYDDLVGRDDQWPRAHRELLKLLFEDAGGRFEPSKHGEINVRLAELHEILNLPVPRHVKVEKKRTRFGDKKLPIADGSHGTYSKMQRSENLAGIWMGLGFDKGEDHLFDLPRDGETERLYLKLHDFALDPEEHQAHELADALKAYFQEVVMPDETPIGVSMRLYCLASERDDTGAQATAHTEKLEVATQFLRVKGLITELELLRTTFRDKCAAAMPLLESVLEPFKTDADEDDEAACAAPEGAEVDEDEEELEEEEEAHEKRVKKLKSIDPSERAQTVDLFFNKLRPPKGTRDARQNAFKGEAGPHIAELFYAILHRSQGRERMPVVQAPTYEQGAELRWIPEARAGADGRLCELKPPPENPEAETVVTAKIQSMPNAEEIKDAYCELHTLARRLNDRTRGVVQYILNTFSLAVCLHVAKRPSLAAADCVDAAGRPSHNMYQYDADTAFAQEMVLYQVYMDAIFTPSEEGEEEAEGEEAEGEEEEALSDSDPEDGDYDEEAGSSGPSDDDASDDDDDDDDDDASADSDDDDGGSADGSGSDSDAESDN